MININTLLSEEIVWLKIKLNVFLENIKDLRKNPRAWLTSSRIYIRSIFMSNEEKNYILNKAKNIAETILHENGLNLPYIVYLDFERDIYFRTVATYHCFSLEKGIIKISIKSHLIGKDVNRIVQAILHEFSHAIYEFGLSKEFAIGDEIANLKNHFINLSVELAQDEFIYGIDYDKEKFCDGFSLYLMDKMIFNENKELDKICKNIIQIMQTVVQN